MGATPPPWRPSFPLWMRAVVLAVPLLFALLGVGLAVEAARFAEEGVAAEGEVVSIRTETRTRKGLDGFSETRTTDWPTVRYEGPGGALLEHEVEVAHGERRIGERLAVRYLPGEPWRVRLSRGFWDLWLAPAAFTAVGGGLTAGLLVLFRKFERMDRARYRETWGIDPR